MSDAGLPPIWEDPVPRFDHYARVLAGHWTATGLWAPNCWITTLAVGAAESGLNQFRVGENQRNGTPPESNAYYSVGYSWLQADSYWIWRNVEEGHWPIEECRPEPFLEKPTKTLQYLLTCPGYVRAQNQYVTFPDWTKWSTYNEGDHVPFLEQAQAAVLRL